MTSVKINYKGIARAASGQDIEDGYLDEAINVRHRDGKLQPRGNITKKYDLPDDTFDQVYYHDQDNINNYIGYIKASGQVRLIDMDEGSSTLVYTLDEGTACKIVFVKRFMIVVSDSKTYTFLYYDGSYEYVNMSSELLFSLTKANAETVVTDAATSADSLRGKYFKEVNKMSEKYGKLTGGIMVRAALKMFDGSYVMHTLPQFLDLGVEMQLIQPSSSKMKLAFSASQIRLALDVDGSGINDLNNKIFTDFVLFACKNEPIYDIDEDTMDDDWWDDAKDNNNMGTSDLGYSLAYLFTDLNPAFSKMADTGKWYKIYEKSIEKIQDMSVSTLQDIINDDSNNLKGFYQDYATRETLTVDQESHHSLSGAVGYTYNDRLILGDITTCFGQYPVTLQTLSSDDSGNYVEKRTGLVTTTAATADGVTEYVIQTLTDVTKTTGTIALEYTINTGGSKIIVTKQLTDQVMFISSDSSTYYFVLPPVTGYPDTRATKMRLLYYDPANSRWIAVATYTLKQSSSDNYAYYKQDISLVTGPFDDSTDIGDTENPQTAFRYIIATLSADDFDSNETTLDDQEDYYDSNRVQASGLQNPLYFPTKNSYQAGTGEIVGLAANTEPLSQGQFGEYPLTVFTSKGIWTLSQGSDDVLFSNILPVNGEVAEDADQIVPLSVGVTYSTSRGLYLVSGRDVNDLTAVVKGLPNAVLQANENYLLRIKHDSLVQLSDYLSKVDIRDYISGAIIGFDKLNNELVITNDSYNYTYVYSFESKLWYKFSNSFSLLVNAYPKLLGMNDTAVYSISDETFDNTVQSLLTTRPCKLGTGAAFKLITRAIQRCELEVNGTITTQVETLEVTGAATAAGTITVSVFGTDYTLEVTEGETAAEIAEAIAALDFSNASVSYTSGESAITFTSLKTGIVTGCSFTDTGSTGTTATFTVATKGNAIFAGFYVFASNDLRKWVMLTGNDRKEGKVTDIRVSRCHTKAKYFIFVFAADLEEDSRINDIEVEFEMKLNGKIR